jgi:DNA-directed RNA polymerase subunit RPC12/RpoP
MMLVDDELATDTCARCGQPLEPDQEWCLECGSARTIVHRPPDPRIGAAIAGGIALVVLAAAVVAVILAGHSAGGTSISPTASAPRRMPTSAHRSTSGNLASWPVGLSGWTVVLGRSPDRASATATARQLAAQGVSTGVLDSSQHPHLQPGYYVVFSGRYPDGTAAQAAAAALQAKGQPQAIAREVARPGGL